jgi:hypothetical protein
MARRTTGHLITGYAGQTLAVNLTVRRPAEVNAPANPPG